MFAPIAVDNIAFPQSSSMSTLDFIPESFEAFEAYSNYTTSSTATSQSFSNVVTYAQGRWGMGPNGRILGVSETGTTANVWDTNTNTLSAGISLGTTGTNRNVVWDNVTNSWVVCGTSNFVKVNCDTLATTAIAVPTGQTGTQYPSVVAFGGKAYALPLVSAGSSTKVAIFNLVNNTSTLSANTIGVAIAGFWGAVLTSIGTIYFFAESAGTNISIYEYNPITDTGTAFATLTGNPGYGPINLPNGNVFAPGLGVNQNAFIINPRNKSIQTITSAGFGYGTGICVGQTGHPFGVRSAATGDNGIWGFNTRTNSGYLSNLSVQRPSSGDRGFQDMFSLPDGRLVLMPGNSNSGILAYYTFLSQPANNTFSSIGSVNPIMTSGKGT